jgi:hypothetical protein
LDFEKDGTLQINGLEKINFPVVQSMSCNPQSTLLFPIFETFEQLKSNEIWFNYLQQVYLNTITEKS